MNKKICDIGLSVRVRNALHREGINTTRDIQELASQAGTYGILGLRNIGKKALDEIKQQYFLHTKTELKFSNICTCCGQRIGPKNGSSPVCIWNEERKPDGSNFYLSGCELATWSGTRGHLKKNSICWGCGKPIIIKVQTPAGPGYIDTRLSNPEPVPGYYDPGSHDEN